MYEQALLDVLKSSKGYYSKDDYYMLKALYSIFGDSELYDGMMNAAEDSNIDEMHIEALTLIELREGKSDES